MEQIIVYVDDAEHALHQLTPMLMAGGLTRWVVVACPPRMTRHASKWIHHAAKETWRLKWAEKLFARLLPALQRRGDEVTTLVAMEPLPQLSARLIAQGGAARILDARRPKFGLDMAPVTADQPIRQDSRWALPGSVATLGAVLILASE